MRVAAIVAGVMALTACGLSSPPAPRRSEAMERSARMLRQLDRLEAELGATHAETGTYAELVRRHSQAEQMACKVTDEHVAEIHRLAEAQQEKLQQRRVARQRVKKKAVAQLVSRKGRS